MAQGVPCDKVEVEHDRPYLAIIEAATERGCDLIAMTSHGRGGVASLVIGSETARCSPTRGSRCWSTAEALPRRGSPATDVNSWPRCTPCGGAFA
ncbi:universal stress protein [Methylobrevis pamukkalensis]|uniref:Universal stress protein family protein n=1 Tax=Methylobrevis pamukkalensis TaxID=1439726 RepID=A0A1E3GZH7_9HYPH|nr:universal stress protein [Methylobrevis pamukkalensis]ODN69478.1 Universal stress protein family protein [Methylobrevis pamukkalensis]